MITQILAASGRAANTGPITAVHLSLIAILMVLAVAVIFWGAIQKRRRSKGETEAEERQAEMEAAAPAESAPSSSGSAEPAPPEPEAASATAASDSIPLTRLKGLGPKAAALLGERGIDDVAALAALPEDRAAAIDADLGAFSGRLSKDRWVEQAKLLTAGDTASYEKQFGKLG